MEGGQETWASSEQGLGPLWPWPHRIIWKLPEPSRAFQNLPEAHACLKKQIACMIQFASSDPGHWVNMGGGLLHFPPSHSPSSPVKYLSNRSGFLEMT